MCLQYFDHINAALESKRDLFQKYLAEILIFKGCVCVFYTQAESFNA